MRDTSSNDRLVELLGRAPGSRVEPIYQRHEVRHSSGAESLVRQICRDGSFSVPVPFVSDAIASPYESVLKQLAIRLGSTGSRVAKVPDQPPEAEFEQAVLQRVLRSPGTGDREDFRAATARAVAGESLSPADLDLLHAHVGSTGFGAWCAIVAVVSHERIRGAFIGLPPVLGGMLWLMGPAHRKVIPTVVEIALIRRSLAGPIAAKPEAKSRRRKARSREGCG